MIVFNDDKFNRIRSWMEDWRNEEDLLKLGQRFAPMPFMDLMALKVKFNHLKKIISARQQIKTLYEKELSTIKGLVIFKDRPGVESVAQNFVVFSQHRDQLADFLFSKGIMVQKPYVPLHQMKVYKEIKKDRFEVSERYFRQALHLPLYSFMPLEKARYVIECCRSFQARSHR